MEYNEFPPDKVDKSKETNHDHSEGRWTKKEQILFIKGIIQCIIALQKYGKKWEDIKTEIPSRTVIQIKTHAQKFFLKISKNLDPNINLVEYVQANPVSHFINSADYVLNEDIEKIDKKPLVVEPLMISKEQIINPKVNSENCIEDEIIKATSLIPTNAFLPPSYILAVGDAIKRLHVNLQVLKTGISSSINYKREVIESDKELEKYWTYLCDTIIKLETMIYTMNCIHHNTKMVTEVHDNKK